MSNIARTDRTDRQLRSLPTWAQDLAVADALRGMRDSEMGAQASFQDALENTLDLVYSDTYVFARRGDKTWIADGERMGVTQGTIVCESGRRVVA